MCRRSLPTVVVASWSLFCVVHTLAWPATAGWAANARVGNLDQLASTGRGGARICLVGADELAFDTDPQHRLGVWVAPQERARFHSGTAPRPPTARHSKSNGMIQAVWR